MNGIIALDIDGTITDEHHTIEQVVLDYLNRLAKQGWHIIFITGRPFNWGYELLKSLRFPYHFAVQNGAIILEMPSRKIIAKKYLNRTILPVMERICEGEETDVIVYGGYEYQDYCFYRPGCFSKKMLAYLDSRRRGLNEEWYPLGSFQELPLEYFPSVKCFSSFESLDIVKRIERELGLHAPMIRDPFNNEYYVIQSTHPQVNKGEALRDFKHLVGDDSVVVAAGDDNNDLSMFAIADVKIVMATAPKNLLELADVVAPPASEKGIIAGLSEAIKGLEEHRFGRMK